jgi:uncharacterized protein (UPF0335 family)
MILDFIHTRENPVLLYKEKNIRKVIARNKQSQGEAKYTSALLDLFLKRYY